MYFNFCLYFLLFLNLHLFFCFEEPDWWKIYYIKHDIREIKPYISNQTYRLLHKRPDLLVILRNALQETIYTCELLMPNKTDCHPVGKTVDKNIFSFKIDSLSGSLMLALTSAASVGTIAVACSEGRLRDCSCPVHGISQRWLPCSYGAGSHNLHYAQLMVRKLTERPLRCLKPQATRRVLLHNLALGREAVTLYAHCICHTRLFPCTAELCALRVSPWISVLRRIGMSFKSALPIWLSDYSRGSCSRSRSRLSRKRKRLVYIKQISKNDLTRADFFNGLL